VPDQHFIPHIFFGLDPLVVSTLILCITYAIIIWDKLNRAIVAMLGAAVMVVIGALNQNEALKGIDWNTIGLLTGMMILVSISRRSGMFEYLAVWSAQKASAHPAGILLLLQITTAVMSALLDNVTTVLLIVPVTLAITKELDVPPYPFLFAEIFASNIGGTATLIGDPPNILIGSLAGLDFNAFVIHLAPVIIVIMAVQALMIHLLWGKSLTSTVARKALVMGMNARSSILDWTLLKQSLAVLAVVIVAFMLARPLHLEPATIALAGAAVLMFLDNWQHHNEKQSENVHKTFSDVEWITIFFFVGLFVVVHGVEVGGLLGLTEAAVYTAVHRLRKRYGELLREEVAHTVSIPADIDGEIRYLFSAVRH
jgi:Na+/H+ antiporter NhaD/arsenite permease-like protein